MQTGEQTIMNFGPEDTLLIQFEQQLTAQEMAVLMEQVKRILRDGQRALILSKHARVDVLNRTIAIPDPTDPDSEL